MNLFDRRIHSILSANDMDNLIRIFIQLCIFRCIHDTLRIKITQAVGNDADIVVRKSWYTIIVIFGKLTNLFPYDIFIEYTQEAEEVI